MGRNTEGIKDLILEILKEKGKMSISSLLGELNSRLDDGITEDELQRLISDMPEKINRDIQINAQLEEVELAPAKPSPLPPSVTRNNIEELPTKRVGMPKQTNT